MIINPCGKRLNKEVMQKLAQVEPATVGHFLSSGVMISDFRSSLVGKRIVGHAVTLKLPTIDSVLCHHVLEVALPGDIVVIDRGGNQTHACWGAAMTYAAKSRFLAGAVIDGSVTDILDVQRMNFPVFYRRLSALTTKLNASVISNGAGVIDSRFTIEKCSNCCKPAKSADISSLE